MKTPPLRVAILDDHQTISDGYRYRLDGEPDIEVVASMLYGDQLESTLDACEVDILLLDIEVPTSPSNENPYPILAILPKILRTYPDIVAIIISMHAQSTMISNLMEIGVQGYVLKEDHEAIQGLAGLIRSIADGGVYMSQYAYQKLMKSRHWDSSEKLSPRQLEVLALSAAYPDETTAELSLRLGIAPSTLRNILGKVYLKLGVHCRAAAITKATNMGLITSRST